MKTSNITFTQFNIQRPGTDRIAGEIKAELDTLAQLINRIEEKLSHSRIQGHLRIAHTAKGDRYYHVLKKGDTKGRYLPKAQKPYAEKLAQHTYYCKLLKESRRWYRALEKCLSILPETSLSAIPDLKSGRRELVSLEFLTDSELTERWSSVTFEGNSLSPESKVYQTKSGIKVRSKSEKIIADMLYDKGIPFRYEQPLSIAGRTVYPDFTLLDVHNRREIVLEHLGMMDDSEYVTRNLRKICDYLHAGFIPGKNLLLTAETKSSPLDTAAVEVLLKESALTGAFHGARNLHPG